MEYSELNKFKIDNEEDLNKILESPYILGKIFEYSIIAMDEDYIYARILKAKENIDKLIVDKIKNSTKSPREMFRINNYINLLCEISKKDSTIIFSIPLLKLDDDVLKQYLTNEKYDMIYNMVVETNEKAKKIYDMFMDNQIKVKKDDYIFLIKFFTNTINSNILNIETAHKNMIKKLMNSFINYDDLRTKNFIIHYLYNEEKKNINHDTSLFLCDFFIDGEFHTNLGRKTKENIGIRASSFRKSKLNGLFAISDDKIKKMSKEERKKLVYPIYKLFYILYHEIRHLKQIDLIEEGKINSKSMAAIEAHLFREYYEDREYYRNYGNYEIEIDANIYASEKTIEFYENFAPKKIYFANKNLINYKKNETMKRSYSFKKDKNGIKFANELFIVENLNNILFKHPELLEEFPFLKEFYNDKVILKNLDELLIKRNYYKVIKEDHSIFDKYIIYHIQKGNLERLNLLNYDENKMISILMMLEEILSNEIQKLYDINEQYNNSIKLKEIAYEIVVGKINMINNIINFFNQYDLSQDFNKLITTDLEKYKTVINLLEKKLNKENLIESKGENFDEYKFR